jgi:hypothetical protein
LIAVVSLGVSIYQARAARQHNRHSVRPILQISRSWHVGSRARLHLVNVGLGPALIVECTLTVDGNWVGSWQEASVNRMRDSLSVRPSAVTFNDGAVIATNYDQYLLSVPSYDPHTHAEFMQLINSRLSLKIRYESLYGGENYEVSFSPSPSNPPDDR